MRFVQILIISLAYSLISLVTIWLHILIIIILIIIIKFKRQLHLKELLPPVGDEAVVFVHVCKENQERCEVLGPETNQTRWEEIAPYGRCPSPIKNADVDEKVLKAEFRNRPNSPHNLTKAYHHFIINNNFLKVYIV